MSSLRDKVTAADKRNADRDDGIGVEARFRLRYGHINEFIAREIARGTDFGECVDGALYLLASFIATMAINSKAPTLAAIEFLRELTDETRRALELCRAGTVEGSFIRVDKNGNIVEADPLEGFK
jgi:hypothetical protein